MSNLAAQRSLALVSPDEHGDGLHPQPRHGTVLVWNQRSSGQQWRKIQPDDDLARVLGQQRGQRDRFISVNQFHGWRLVRLLRSLRALYVDLDGCSSVDHALQVVRDAVLPEPNYIVESGRGLHLYWLIDAVPSKALPVWQAVQAKLIESLSELGSDAKAKDCTRVLRLVGSINSKSQTEVVGWVNNPHPWTLRTLADEVLGFREDRPRKKGRVTSMERKRADLSIHQKTGVYRLWHSRYADLVKIADYHSFMQPGGLTDGRDRLIFLCSVALGWYLPPERITDETRRLAQTFAPTMTLAHAEKASRSVVKRAEQAHAGKKILWNGRELDPRYHFKTDTIREWLHEFISDELEPQLHVLCSPERRAERDKKRRQDRDSKHRSDRYQQTQAQRQAETDERGQEAVRLRGKGMKQREIAAQLGVTQQAVAYLLKKYKQAPPLHTPPG